MAYQWCSAISEVAGPLGLDVTRTSRQTRFYTPAWGMLLEIYGPSRLGDASRVCDRLRGPISWEFPDFHIPLEVAFRRVGPTYNEELRLVDLTHTSHHVRVFEAAFSSDDDDVIADAACAWITLEPRPTGSCARYFAERVENPRPFSPRLRRVSIHAIEDNWLTELTGSGLEVVRLLNRLDYGVGDFRIGCGLEVLLMHVIRSPVGENLSPHYWRLLGELESTQLFYGMFKMRDVEVMKSLEEADDWEKLEVWIAVVWQSLHSAEATPELVEVVGDATLRLILLRASALQRFETLPKRVWADGARAGLVEVLDQARVGRLVLEAQHPPYVSVHPSPSGSLFLPYPSFLPANYFPPSHLFPFFLLETTLSQIMPRVDVQMAEHEMHACFFCDMKTYNHLVLAAE